MSAVKSILARLTHGLPLNFLRNLRWQYVATFGTALLGGLYLILVGRVLGVREFGVYSLCLSVATLISNFVDLRLQEVAIRFLSHPEGEHGEERAQTTLLSLFAYDAVARSVAAIATLAAAPLLARTILHDASAFSYIALAAAAVFFSKVGNMPAAGVLRVADRFEWTAWLTLTDWSGRLVVTAVAAVVFGLSIPLILLLALIVSGTINLATIWFSLTAWRLRHPRRYGWRVSLGNRELWKFIGSCYGISICDNAAKEFDTTLVGGLLNVEAAGIYRMTKSFVYLVWRIGDPIFLVVMPEFTRLLRQSRDELLHFLRRLTASLAVATLAIYVISVALMPLVVRLFLGAKFAAVATVYPIMLSFVLIALPTVWSHALLAAAGRPDIQLRANVLGNLILVVAMYALASRFGVYGAAAGWSLGLAATFVLSFVFLWRARIV